MVAMGPVSGQAITLANSIIGVGILAMPFCFKQCGIILSIAILIGSGLMSRLACHFLLKSAIYSRRKNFESLAYHVFGSAGKFGVEVGIIGFLMGTCVAYFVVVGDLGPQIIAKMFNLNQSDALRTCVMVIVSLVCVLPLGLLRNVDSLSNVCAATIGFYFCLVLKIFGEAATPLFSGEWIDKVKYWEPSGVLQCLPIFSMALFCQTQLFEIYDTLPNATLDKMNNVTKNAVNICSVVYILVGLFGYIAFCNQPISGNVLISFSPTMASDAIHIGFVMSLAFSFPLIIFPCRVSLYSLLYKKGQASPHELLNHLIPEVNFRCLTITIIGISLLVGLMLPNIELVLGLVGSTIGVMISVIFPATCFICLSTKNTNERLLAQIVLCFGIIIMVLGTYANLQAVEMDKIAIENKIILEMDRSPVKPTPSHNWLSSDKIDMNVQNKIPPIETVHDEPTIDKTRHLENDKNTVVVVKSDSKVQPPNPVPPKGDQNKSLNSKTISQTTLSWKVSETKTEIPSKDDKMEGAGDKEVQLNTVRNQEDTKANSDLKEKEQQEETEEIKKKTLMDTIKRHAEEQRQLVIEQKKILEEIKETKKDIEIKQRAEENKSSETKKLAVENIQKIAQAAIETLQGLSEKVDKNNTKTLKTEHSETKIKELVTKTETNIKNDHLPETVHIHKADEPESYKAGEDTEYLNKMKKVEGKPSKVINGDPSKQLPIAMTLAKMTEIKELKSVVSKSRNTDNESFKEVKNNVENSKVAVVDKPVVDSNNNNTRIENEKVNNVEKSDNVQQEDYVGGKRDILEVIEQSTTKEDIHESHNRKKRHVAEDCPDKLFHSSGESQICKAKDINTLE